MRIGLLGSGTMGQRHLTAASRLAGVEMITRSSPPYDRIDPSDRATLIHAILADSSIDAIDICLPTSQHVSVALAALAAGKHVLCEKPLALNIADCSRIVDAACVSGRVLMVAHVVRFFPAYRYLAEMIRSRELGSVQRARFTRSSATPAWAAWLTDSEQSGGAILDLLVHDFDQVVALFGMPSHIAAEPLESSNTVRCNLDCGGVPVDVEGGWFADDRPFSAGFDVEFATARLVYSDERFTLHRPGAAEEEIPLADADPYTEQLRSFVRCCMPGGELNACTPQAAADAVALALAVRNAVECDPG
jgi:predicted dehydrogenase